MCVNGLCLDRKLVLFAVIISVLAVVFGCTTSSSPVANETSSSNKTSLLNETSASCGGVAGIPCPEGFVCSYDDDSGIVDDVGTCVKVEVQECGGLLDVSCPVGFECAFNATGGETVYADAFGECVPVLLSSNVSGKCNVSQAYDTRSSRDVGCVCPAGFGFKDVTLGFFRTGNIEARIPGVECVRVK
ncbi:hypothetical protein HY992_05960 [Candidatus Micrarchaeota archaeon]|nr:hypothetical protein [Candidatus Micrarchaeota archaeon]